MTNVLWFQKTYKEFGEFSHKQIKVMLDKPQIYNVLAEGTYFLDKSRPLSFKFLGFPLLVGSCPNSALNFFDLFRCVYSSSTLYLYIKRVFRTVFIRKNNKNADSLASNFLETPIKSVQRHHNSLFQRTLFIIFSSFSKIFQTPGQNQQTVNSVVYQYFPAILSP